MGDLDSGSCGTDYSQVLNKSQGSNGGQGSRTWSRRTAHLRKGKTVKDRATEPLVHGVQYTRDRATG